MADELAGACLLERPECLGQFRAVAFEKTNLPTRGHLTRIGESTKANRQVWRETWR